MRVHCGSKQVTGFVAACNVGSGHSGLCHSRLPRCKAVSAAVPGSGIPDRTPRLAALSRCRRRCCSLLRSAALLRCTGLQLSHRPLRLSCCFRFHRRLHWATGLGPLPACCQKPTRSPCRALLAPASNHTTYGYPPNENSSICKTERKQQRLRTACLQVLQKADPHRHTSIKKYSKFTRYIPPSTIQRRHDCASRHQAHFCAGRLLQPQRPA